MHTYKILKIILPLALVSFFKFFAMKRILFCFVFIPLFFTAQGQINSSYIVIDQFGYRPDAQKTAVIRNPKTGLDAGESFTPGSNYQVINVATGAMVFENAPEYKFDNDAASGDEIWWFDFSSVSEPGRYYILDAENSVRSFEFNIADNVYNEVLKHSIRMFFYQRAGHEKLAKFAGEGWADAASHLQDRQARYFFDKNNAATERDLSGGWYDAGDFNKYTAWTARYVEDLLDIYRQNPNVFSDNYNIPESGNGIPDILDEAKWGMEHLLKMQNDANYTPTVIPAGYPNNIASYDGSVLSIVGLAGSNSGANLPPSRITGASYYGPPSTTATYAAARAFALGAIVFEQWDAAYANTLETAARKAWMWAEANPNVMFNNNVSSNNSEGLAAGNQEIGDNSTGGRTENRLYAATYMYEMTGEKSYLELFDDNYQIFPLYAWWGFMDHYRTSQHLLFFRYMNYPDATPAVVAGLKNGDRGMIAAFNKPEDFAGKIGQDGYRSFLKDYPWGSNRAKSEMGITFWAWNEYNMESNSSVDFVTAAEDYLHYIHGVNPFNMVYLTNMNNYGASKSLTSLYHDWFYPGTPWDKVGVSQYGPAPAYLPGGPNQNFNIQQTNNFPNFGGYVSVGEELELLTFIKNELVGSPPAKMYVDINNGWPVNSWEITEPSCGYQTAYIRLLSKFVTENENIPNSITKPQIKSVSIYPNPAQEIITIEGLEQGAVFQIYTTTGICIGTYVIRPIDNTINISHLPKGVYFVASNGKKAMFVKQ